MRTDGGMGFPGRQHCPGWVGCVGFGGTSGGRTAHISPSQPSRCEQLKAPPWQTLGRQKHVFRRLHALLHPPPPQPDHGPHQRVQFWVSTVPEGSSWACSAGVKVRPQGRESWTQGHAAGGTHVPSCSSWGGVGSSYARTTASRPPHPTPPQPCGSPGTAPAPTLSPGQPQPGRQGSGAQREPGQRCEQRRGHEVAQALNTWPGGHSGGSAQVVAGSPREGAALDCHLPWPMPAATGP